MRYLVEDVGRRYGHACVGAALAYVTVDDPALLAEIVRSKKLASLALREIAPTVAVSTPPQYHDYARESRQSDGSVDDKTEGSNRIRNHGFTA